MRTPSECCSLTLSNIKQWSVVRYEVAVACFVCCVCARFMNCFSVISVTYDILSPRLLCLSHFSCFCSFSFFHCLFPFFLFVLNLVLPFFVVCFLPLVLCISVWFAASGGRVEAPGEHQAVPAQAHEGRRREGRPSQGRDYHRGIIPVKYVSIGYIGFFINMHINGVVKLRRTLTRLFLVRKSQPGIFEVSIISTSIGYRYSIVVDMSIDYAFVNTDTLPLHQYELTLISM